jgi:DNA-binding response OmpR family regulator
MKRQTAEISSKHACRKLGVSSTSVGFRMDILHSSLHSPVPPVAAWTTLLEGLDSSGSATPARRHDARNDRAAAARDVVRRVRVALRVLHRELRASAIDDARCAPTHTIAVLQEEAAALFAATCELAALADVSGSGTVTASEMADALRALLPESSPAQHRLAVDDARHSIALDGRTLHLTPVQFRMLRTLAGTPGRVYSRDALMNGVYDDGRVVLDRTVDSHVRDLRRKLARVAPGEILVRSVYGIGYRLDPVCVATSA